MIREFTHGYPELDHQQIALITAKPTTEPLEYNLSERLPSLWFIRLYPTEFMIKTRTTRN
ncbi:hypothetical protein PCANC_07975 [Puccinia coronata f. sp. avenae]|uniref:Uncharacterized protein n=1 Tax=Puccinia coronata f. sp. avenae TaxID=200324 RepID=A0A2N5UG97_9BASI|nr:hypothetical protein PCANC_14434 [Puccinia coronata f. sp. avenae]PLW36740.1 hypothetical protein PCASD_08682 [Puccinia coronata f. sp. avenae]PLW42828.1 hypothetical protein PCANC_07975 [Puccinia coronata f. sp. avenae]